jgi:hypothetical protein
MSNYYFYNIHGMNIKSSLFFPELIEGNTNYEAIIHYEKYESFNLVPKEQKGGFSKIVFSTQDILYLYDNQPIFRVRNGTEIIVNPKIRIDLMFLRYLILGQGIGTLLMQKGSLVLHASSVNMGGRAVVFIGLCGYGKSTIATALNQKGYSFITDDVLRIEFQDNEEMLAFPSYPASKLWDDTITNLNDKKVSFLKVHPDVEKFTFNIDNFSVEPLPITTIYVLENSDKNEIIPLKPQEALITLIKNSYALFLFNSEDKNKNLFQCAKLANNVPIKYLKRHKNLKEIKLLIKMIEKDVLGY